MLKSLQSHNLFSVIKQATQNFTTEFSQAILMYHFFNVHGSVYRKYILLYIYIYIYIYIQQEATLHSLFYLETALHVSGGTTTHHQERKQLSIASGICHSVTFIYRYGCRDKRNKYSPLMCFSPGAHGGAVGWGTALQTGRSRVRFPMVSLPSSHSMALALIQPLKIKSTRHISWG